MVMEIAWVYGTVCGWPQWVVFLQPAGQMEGHNCPWTQALGLLEGMRRADVMPGGVQQMPGPAHCAHLAWEAYARLSQGSCMSFLVHFKASVSCLEQLGGRAR